MLATQGLVREAGADEVVVGDDLSAASAYGPYHLIVRTGWWENVYQARSLSWHQGQPVLYVGAGGISRDDH